MVEIQESTMHIIWIIAVIVFGILEASTAQLVSIWFVCGSLAALIASLCGATLTVQVILFVAITILALVITRPLVKKYIKPKIEHTNADRVIGQTATVIEEINNLNATGVVKADGKEWSARSANDSIIPCNTLVEVKSISGVKLIVEEKN